VRIANTDTKKFEIILVLMSTGSPSFFCLTIILGFYVDLCELPVVVLSYDIHIEYITLNLRSNIKCERKLYNIG